MSTLMMMISATLHPVVSAASTGKVLVQQTVGLGATGTSADSATFAAAPTVGNTLVMFVSGSQTISATNPSGWTLVSKPTAATGQRAIYKKASVGSADTTMTGPVCSGTHNIAIQEWAGSVTVTPAQAGQSVSGSAAFSVGGLSAPSASAVPVIMGVAFGQVTSNPATWPTGWTSVGPAPNGASPYYGATIAYGSATASAVSALSVGYIGARQDGVTVGWVGVWIS